LLRDSFFAEQGKYCLYQIAQIARIKRDKRCDSSQLFPGMKLQDKSYAPGIGFICKITLWTLFNYLLPSHFFNDSLTIL